MKADKSGKYDVLIYLMIVSVREFEKKTDHVLVSSLFICVIQQVSFTESLSHGHTVSPVLDNPV